MTAYERAKAIEEEENQKRIEAEKKRQEESERLPIELEKARAVREEIIERFGGDMQKIMKYAKGDAEKFCALDLGWEFYQKKFYEQKGNTDYDIQYDMLEKLIMWLEGIEDEYLPAKYYEHRDELEKEFEEVKSRISYEKWREIKPSGPTVFSSDVMRRMETNAAAGSSRYDLTDDEIIHANATMMHTDITGM